MNLCRPPRTDHWPPHGRRASCPAARPAGTRSRFAQFASAVAADSSRTRPDHGSAACGIAVLALVLAFLAGGFARTVSAEDKTEKSKAPVPQHKDCVPAIPKTTNGPQGPSQQPAASAPNAGNIRMPAGCLLLFDGKTLNGWKPTPFGGEGDVYVKDGQIILETGADLTGITWAKPEILPKTNYEVELDAMRVNGSDFFCGLTFPVGKDSCSLILGGWGGGVCGLSSLDGFDASENETTTYKEFKNKRWYHVRLRVTPERITAWLDKEELVDVDIRKRQIGTRPEVDLSRPFGIASWQTTAALKNIVVRRLPAAARTNGAAPSGSPQQ